MKKVLFIFLLLFFSFPAYSIVLPTFTPSQTNVEKIVIGTVIKAQNGRLVLDEKSEEFSNKVAAYLRNNFDNTRNNITVKTDIYFPENCGFLGTFLSRYNPSSGGNEDKTLYLFYFLEEDGRGGMRDSLELCLVTLSISEEWSEIDMQDKYISRCSEINSKNILDRNFCLAKYNLDGIIWSLTHSDKEKEISN